MKTVRSLAAAGAALVTLVAAAWFLAREADDARPGRAEPVASAESTRLEPGRDEPPAPGPDLAPLARSALESAPGASRPGSPAAAALRPARVDARVADEAGAALAGVQVFRHDELVGQSAAGGEVELELRTAERETTVELEFRHPGYAARPLQVRLGAGAEVHLGEIVLRAAGELHGWVEDAAGRRVAGARVIAAALENARSDREELRRHGPVEDGTTLAATSAADGTFRIEGVPLGPARLWAGAEGWAWSSIGPLEVERRGGDLRLVLEELRRDDRISGVVLDPGGTPVAGAGVGYWFTAASYGTGGSIETDREGRFELLLQQRVAHDLTISDAENRWSEIYASGVEPGTRELELAFSLPSWIDVSVSDEQGRPLEAYELVPEGTLEGQWLAMKPRVEPLRPGHARLRVPSADFRLAASAHGHERELRGPFDPRHPPAALAFELARLPGVRGRVLTSAGQPAAGAVLELVQGLGRRITMRKDGFRLVVHPYSEIQATADAEGRFELFPPEVEESDFESGEFVLTAEAPGHALTCLPPRRFDPREGVELDIRLVRGGAIEGRVLTAPGVDPTGFVLALHRGDGRIRTLRLGPDGRYRVEGLTPGPWQVRGMEAELAGNRSGTSSSHDAENDAPPMEDWSCEVVDGETTRHDVDLADFAPCTVRGRLTLERRSLDGWTASLHRELQLVSDEVLGSTLLGPSGEFELEARRAGVYRLVLRAPEHVHGRLEIAEELQLAPGVENWSLELAPGRLEGSGALDRGTRERFYSYEWRSPAAGRSLTATVRIVPDADGRFVLPTLPEGAGRIRRNDPPADGQRFGEWETVAELDLAPGGAETVVLP